MKRNLMVLYHGENGFDVRRFRTTRKARVFASRYPKSRIYRIEKRGRFFDANRVNKQRARRNRPRGG